MGPRGCAPVPSITVTPRITRRSKGPSPSPARLSGAGLMRSAMRCAFRMVAVWRHITAKARKREEDRGIVYRLYHRLPPFAETACIAVLFRIGYLQEYDFNARMRPGSISVAWNGLCAEDAAN